MKTMALSVLVRLKDRLSGKLGKLQSRLSAFGKLAAKLGAVGLVAGGISFLGPIQSAAAFQQELLDIALTADQVGNKAFAFADKAGDAYETLSLKVGQASRIITEGAGELVAAGLSVGVVNQSIGTIGRSATAANAAFSDMASVSRALIQTLKTSPDDLADSLGGLVVAGKQGAFELKDMARFFPQLTSQVSKFNLQGREASDTLGALLQIARKGTSDPSIAANNLNNFLSKALAPITKKNFEKAGVDIEAVLLDAVSKGINPIEAMIEKIQSVTGVSDKLVNKYLGQAKSLGLEGAEAIDHVRESLEKIGGASKLGELFGDLQVLDFLVPMLANIEEYKRIKDAISSADASVIDDDFETQIKGLNRQLEIFKELGVQVGREFGSVMGQSLAYINPLLTSLLNGYRALNAASDGLIGKGLALAAGLLSLTTVIGALSFLVPVVTAGWAALAVAAGFVAGLSLPIIALIAAVAGLATAIYAYWTPIKEFAIGFSSVVGSALGEASFAMSDFIGQMNAFAFNKALDFAELIGFDRSALQESFNQGLQMLRQFGSDVVSFFVSLPSAIGDWASGLFNTSEYTEEAKAGFRNAGEQAGQAMVDAVKGAINGLVDWFTSLPSRILAAVGNIDLSSLISWPSLPSWLGGGSADETTTSQVTPSNDNVKLSPSGGRRRPVGAQPRAAVAAPVQKQQVDVGGAVTIKVDGPGKVTQAASSNPNVPVRAGAGRTTGRV